MKQRIWELDAARGAALIGMVVIHLIYDLVDLFGVIRWNQPVGYLLFKNNYGLLFLVISGISVTLGSRCVKRGFQVFCCGFICTAVTLGMYLLNFTDRSIIIYFGVLHCLGVCMMLWPLFRKSPSAVLVVLGLILVAAGLYLRTTAFPFWWLMPIGFVPYGFASSDYFPLMPNLGYFLLGAAMGRKAYPEKKSLFPTETPRLSFLCWCGRNSLMIYLLHQPVLAAFVAVLAEMV